MGTIRGGQLRGNVSVDPSENGVNYYGQVAAAPPLIEVVVVDVIVPINKILYIRGGSATGTSDGYYKLIKETDIQGTYRTAWTDRVAKFEFDWSGGIVAGAGFEIEATAGGESLVASSETVSTGAWYHLIATYGSGGWEFFSNGAKRGNGVFADQPLVGVTGLTVGMSGWTVGGNRQHPVNGIVDVTRVWDVKLSYANVVYLYNGGAGIEDLTP